MIDGIGIKIQSGPCIICGATNYPLSMGGPNICPPCDCGVPPKQVKLERENSALRVELERKTAECSAFFEDGIKVRTELNRLREQNQNLINVEVALNKKLDRLQEIEKLMVGCIETIGYYADPETYYGLLIYADPPCGSFFTDDLEYTDIDEGRMRPGKKARETLKLLEQWELSRRTEKEVE